MATTAALGKTSASQTISPALYSKDVFYTHQTRFSRPSSLYFHDEQHRTLGFIREASLSRSKEIRVFTDPTLSFELLSIQPPKKAGEQQFGVTDCLNRRTVGSLRCFPGNPMQRLSWSLLDPAGKVIGAIRENSLLLGGMRRVLTSTIPQSYTLYLGDRRIGSAKSCNTLISSRLKIDLTGDTAQQLDRRLISAAVILLMLPSVLMP